MLETIRNNVLIQISPDMWDGMKDRSQDIFVSEVE